MHFLTRKPVTEHCKIIYMSFKPVYLSENSKGEISNVDKFPHSVKINVNHKNAMPPEGPKITRVQY